MATNTIPQSRTRTADQGAVLTATDIAQAILAPLSSLRLTVVLLGLRVLWVVLMLRRVHLGLLLRCCHPRLWCLNVGRLLLLLWRNVNITWPVGLTVIVEALES